MSFFARNATGNATKKRVIRARIGHYFYDFS
jgi:hypothetical protein